MTDPVTRSVKIFADGADVTGIRLLAEDPRIQGFTTNPTLMRKAGVDNYEHFAREVLSVVPDKPISFEVFSDEFEGMAEQAMKIASWGPNVYVKIPVTNTRGETSAPLVRQLAGEGVQVNVTALMTLQQVEEITACLVTGPPSCVSVFAGRIADAGVDPLPLMARSVEILQAASAAELIWASPREVLNVVQAEQAGVHIITMTNDLIAKLGGIGKDLAQFSLETVRMFHDDAQHAGFSL